MNLPSPAELFANATDEQTLAAAAEHFVSLWFDIVEDRISIPESVTVVGPDGAQHLLATQAEVRSRLVQTVCQTYDFAALKLLKSSWERPPHGIPGAAEFLQLTKARKLKGRDGSLNALTLTYLVALYLISHIEFFREIHAGRSGFPEEVEFGLHAILFAHFMAFCYLPSQAHGSARTDSSVQPALAHQLTANLLEFCAQEYLRIKRTAKTLENDQHVPGLFSAFRLRELSLLAARRESMLAKYGEKKIERVFEQQLALVLQSFGLFVIRGRSGERAVDLVCISSDPRARFTFLVDAKSSSRAYSLPVSDQRALREYVEEAKSNLSTFPELKFLLILGSKPAKSLARRIRSLEGELGTPVRFCGAQELANLRESLPGPVPLKTFAELVLASPPVIKKGFAERLGKATRERERALEQAVRTFMARGTPDIDMEKGQAGGPS